MKFWISVIAMLLALVSFEAEAARRLGGGTSIGKQSPNVTQRTAPGAAPNQAAPAAAPVTPAPQRSWGGMLGVLTFPV